MSCTRAASIVVKVLTNGAQTFASEPIVMLGLPESCDQSGEENAPQNRNDYNGRGAARPSTIAVEEKEGRSCRKNVLRRRRGLGKRDLIKRSAVPVVSLSRAAPRFFTEVAYQLRRYSEQKVERRIQLLLRRQLRHFSQVYHSSTLEGRTELERALESVQR